MMTKDKAKKFLDESIEETLNDYKNDKIGLQCAKVDLQITALAYMIMSLDGDPMELLDILFAQMK